MKNIREFLSENFQFLVVKFFNIFEQAYFCMSEKCNLECHLLHILLGA